MKSVSLFQTTLCKVFIRFKTLQILMTINEVSFLCSVTLMMTHVISQMMVRYLNNSNESTHQTHFKNKTNDVEIRCKF